MSVLIYLVIISVCVGCASTADFETKKLLESGEFYHIRSPGFPYYWYPSSYDLYYWKFTAPEDHQLLLSFTYFALKKWSGNVRVQDGYNQTIALLGGPVQPNSVRSPENVMQVLYRRYSDRVIGFDGYVKSVHKEDPCVFVCRGGRCLKQSDLCNWKRDCFLGDDEVHCDYYNYDLHYDSHWHSHLYDIYPAGTDFPDYIGGDLSYVYEPYRPEPCPYVSTQLQTGEYQRVLSVNYPGMYNDNLQCYWEFIVPKDYRALLTFYEFDLEDNYDFLTLSNGGHSTSLISALTGSDNPGSFRSNGTILWIRFNSDSSIVSNGFSAVVKAVHIYDYLCQFVCSDGQCLEYSNVCNGVNNCVGGEDELLCTDAFVTEYPTEECSTVVEFIDDEIIAIESPGFPNEYDAYLDCHWVFVAPENQQLLITFRQFELEYENDILLIGEQNKLTTTLSGQNNPGSVRSTGNVLWLQFKTNHDVSGGGFNAEVVAVNNNDQCMFLCPNGQCISDSAVCNGMRDCNFGEDEWYCSTQLSTDLSLLSFNKDIIIQVISLNSGEHQTVKSLNYPEYNRNSDVFFVVLTPDDNHVVLTFFDVEIEQNDYLAIGNQGSDVVATSLGSLVVGESFQSVGNLLWMQLSSNDAGTNRGFITVIKAVADDDHCSFVCRNGVCLDEQSVCNDIEDCSSGEDEAYCSSNEYLQGQCSPVDLHLASGNSQLINSINYPSNYANNLDCSWDFTSPDSHYLIITFYDFELESCCDRLILHIGGSAAITLTGTTNPGSFKSVGSKMWLKFTSDEIVTTRGFSASIKALPKDFDCGFVCQLGPCISESDVCNGMDDCFLGEDERDCKSPTDSSSDSSNDVGIPIGIVAAGLLVLIAVIIIIVFIIKNRNYRGHNAKSTQNTEPTVTYAIPTDEALYEMPHDKITDAGKENLGYQPPIPSRKNNRNKYESDED